MVSDLLVVTERMDVPVFVIQVVETSLVFTKMRTWQSESCLKDTIVLLMYVVLYEWWVSFMISAQQSGAQAQYEKYSVKKHYIKDGHLLVAFSMSS